MIYMCKTPPTPSAPPPLVGEACDMRRSPYGSPTRGAVTRSVTEGFIRANTVRPYGNGLSRAPAPTAQYLQITGVGDGALDVPHFAVKS